MSNFLNFTYNFFQFVIDKKEQILHLLMQHITLTFFSIVLSILIGVPLGILITKVIKLKKPILGFINVIQAIPSIALLGLIIPVLGIGSVPSITMVVIYSLLPIVKNTYTGLNGIDPVVLESARGIGLTKNQTLRMIQLPLALPMIMAGVRISAVTSVGLMTLAAFIGAGGLGYLIFSGVQTVNNNMILAGAIPAAILALIVDFIFGKIELLVSPKGINPGHHKKVSKGVKIIIPILIIVLLVGVFSNLMKSTKDTIVVGSKSYPEQLILSNMLADLIENNTDLNVERKLNLSGSSIAIAAINSGEIDLYPDYIGTLLINILNAPMIKDPNNAYKYVKKAIEDKYNLTLLEPLGFNNTYAIAMKKDIASKYSIQSISDLTKYSNDFTFGPTLEFENRDDGLKGLHDTYNLKFKDIKAMDGALRYSALESNQVQAIDAFSTDGLLKAFDLKVLQDDKNFFPPYQAIPVIRMDTLEKYPQLKDVINKLSNKIDANTMIELNYKVDKLGEDPDKVAKEFLIKQGLIS